MMRHVEFLVLGLGTMGSATLYQLARRGLKPVGLEQYQLDHALGSSHGYSRAFRPFYHDSLYVEMAQAALPLWYELELDTGQRLLTLNGGLFFAVAGTHRFTQNLLVARKTGLAHELLKPSDIVARYPMLNLPENMFACYVPQGGFVNASKTVRAQLEQARHLGATMHDQVQVRQLDLSGEQPQLETSIGQFRCNRLVVTPGPWAAQILAELSLPLQVTRQQKFYFRPQNIEAYQPEYLPVFADYHSLNYGFPYSGPGLKVADDNLGQVTAPDTIDRTLDPSKQAELKAWLDKIMPQAGFTFVQGSTCMYTVTPDRDFLLGPHPGHKNVWVGAGFSGHGFKFTPLIGKILAELSAEGGTGHPIERFRLDRFEGSAQNQGQDSQT